VALVITIIYYLIRRVITFDDCMKCLPGGFKQMVPAILILTFAWTLSGVTNNLGAKIFVAEFVRVNAGGLANLLPAIVFAIAIGLAFATGTSWGTFGVLLPIVSPEIYLPQSVEDILEVCAAYPDRFIPYCNVDPRSGTNAPNAPLDQVIHYYKERGCKGVGEVMPNMELLDPKVQNLFACAEKEEMPIVYDGSVQKTGDFGLYDDPGLPQLEYTLQDHPKLKIFGHGPVFWNEIARLETVGERGVYWGHTGMKIRLPKGPVKEEGAAVKLHWPSS
jgi:hypothetical protein